MWRVYKEAGRSWPSFDPDDVIDYMVTEAVALKVQKQDEQARKDAERKAWKDKKREELKQTVA